MAILRVQVARRDSTNPSREDDIVNVFYLDDISVPGDATNYDNLANDTATLWTSLFNVMPLNQVEVRVYRMSDAEPRPIRGRHVRGLAAGTESGPREVALCLSFYGTRNLPRQRGRLFIGPWPAAQMSLRPGAGLIAKLKDLADGIANLGGADVDWQVHSTTTNLNYDVTNYWIDNEWDTMRSRGLKATARTLGTTSEA